MLKAHKLPLIIVTLAMLIMISIHQFPASAQPTPTLQPSFGQTISAINQAEIAGATQSEIRPLVNLLNNALELNLEAQELPNGSPTRNQLLLEVNQTLTTVESQAVELTVVASHRTFVNAIIAYIAGIIVALLGTIAYLLAVELNERYLVNRTFRMRVRPK